MNPHNKESPVMTDTRPPRRKWRHNVETAAHIAAIAILPTTIIIGVITIVLVRSA